MAKLTSPLFSLGARGAIGKALVYFPWKGLDVVRGYTVPSNPKTSAQTTQRGFLTAAVAMIHAAQIVAPNPLDAIDQAGYSLLGSLFATPRTWFNTFCKQYLDQHRASLKAAIYRNMTLTPGVTQVTVTAANTHEGANDITAGAVWWGTTKSNLINSTSCTGAELAAGKVVPGLVTGTKYYFQYRPSAHADFVGANSGIFFATAI